MRYLILKISTLNVVLMLLLSSCGNKEKITLQYNFKQGDILKQNVVANMDLVQKMMGQEVKMNLVMGTKMTFEVKECRDDSYTIEVKYKELKVETKIPGMNEGTISFDSNTTEDVATETNLGPVFKVLIDKPFEIVMDKIGKVRSVKGLETFFETMLNTFSDDVPETFRQQIIGQFGSQFSEEAFKSQFEQSTGYFPDKPVSTGDSWKTKMHSSVSNFAVDINMESTLKNVEDNVVNLNINGTVSTPESYEQEVNGVKLKLSLNGAQKGTLKINKDTGWVISSDIMLNFNGEAEAMGMKIPVYAASKITVTDN